MQEYIQEIQESRALMRAIHTELERGAKIPDTVYERYCALMDIYQKEIEEEIM